MSDKKIAEIRQLLNSVLKNLEELSPENFTTVFKQIVNQMTALNETKKDILSLYNKTDYEIYDEELLTLVKEIRKKYDNKIEEYRFKIAETGKRLNEIINLKKIYNYTR